jgi:hypothetical protein
MSCLVENSQTTRRGHFYCVASEFFRRTIDIDCSRTSQLGFPDMERYELRNAGVTAGIASTTTFTSEQCGCAISLYLESRCPLKFGGGLRFFRQSYRSPQLTG